MGNVLKLYGGTLYNEFEVQTLNSVQFKTNFINCIKCFKSYV